MTDVQEDGAMNGNDEIEVMNSKPKSLESLVLTNSTNQVKVVTA